MSDVFSNLGFAMVMLLFLGAGEENNSLDELKRRSTEFNGFLQNIEVPETEAKPDDV